MAYRTGSNPRFYHRFHVVWVTKYRYDVLRGEMRERLREIIRQTCLELDVQIVKGVLSTNHVKRPFNCLGCNSHWAMGGFDF